MAEHTELKDLPQRATDGKLVLCIPSHNAVSSSPYTPPYDFGMYYVVNQINRSAFPVKHTLRRSKYLTPLGDLTDSEIALNNRKLAAYRTTRFDSYTPTRFDAYRSTMSSAAAMNSSSAAGGGSGLVE